MVVGQPPTHMHMYMCTCMHAHTQVHYDIIGISQGSPDGGSHMHEIIIFKMHACVCTCACMKMLICVGVVPTNSHPHLPTIPILKGGTPQISKNSISLEQIEMIQVCLKILYL